MPTALNRSLRNGRNGYPGTRLDSATLVRRYRRIVPEVYGEILEQRDSLLLTAEQVMQVQAAQVALATRTDSVWATLSSHLVSLGDRYDAKGALTRQHDAIAAVWALNWADARKLDGILNPAQLKLLPFPASYLRTATKPPSGF